jgi:hypothetical protein
MDYDKDTPFGLRGDDDDKPKEECAIFGYTRQTCAIIAAQTQIIIIYFFFKKKEKEIFRLNRMMVAWWQCVRPQRRSAGITPDLLWSLHSSASRCAPPLLPAVCVLCQT